MATAYIFDKYFRNLDDFLEFKKSPTVMHIKSSFYNRITVIQNVIWINLFNIKRQLYFNAFFNSREIWRSLSLLGISLKVFN